ncbi:hypothetical protein SEA_HUBBS_73 [Microbacterium phage Hubbs]|nr:hypothetical protein SEA_HUBBS_73 [Microbacterium phage Hubbs]
MSKFKLEEIITMRGDGYSWNKIAAYYGTWRQRMFDWVKAQEDVPDWIFNPLPGGKQQASREDLEAMMKDGLDDHQMAERIGISLSALQRLRTRRGLLREQISVKKTRKTEEELAEVRGLLEAERMSLRAASEVTGMSYETVRRHFPEYAYTTEQRVEAANMGRKLSRIAA